MLKIKSLIFLILWGSVSMVIPPNEQHKPANLRFASKVYEILSLTRDKNFLFSPLSVHYSLSLLLFGADKETAYELSRITCLTDDRHRLILYNQYLSSQLEARDRYGLHVFTRIYHKDVALDTTDFLSPLEDVFNVSNRTIKRFGLIPSKINSKIAKLTKDRINSMEYVLNVIIASSAYLVAEWKTPFLRNFEKFHNGDDYPVGVEMLSTNGNFDYYYDKKHCWEYVQLPFSNDNITMTIALPAYPHGVFGLQKTMFPDFYYIFHATLNEKKNVYVSIPEQFANATNIHFKSILKKLGASISISDKASFSYMAHEYLKIHDVIQETSIKVTTAEVTAAAANVHSATKTVRSTADVQFIANRPFMYYIRHKELGLLFVGRYMGP